MDELFTVATRYETDWVSWVPWAWAISWAVVTAVITVIGVLVARVMGSSGGWIPAVPAVGAAVALSTTVHTIARHIPSGRGAAGLIGGLLVVAVICGVILLLDGAFAATAPVAMVTVGASAVGIMEAATRAAAGVPTSVGALVFLGGIVALWLYFDR